MVATGNGSEQTGKQRRCFVISAFGASAEEKRRHKQVLHHIVQKVLKDRYTVTRADQIDEEGLITNQIIERLLEDDLVVADLTGLNPNVFYEVAVRHAARKPIVHLITKGQTIPFDVSNMRTVQYALDDPDLLEEAQSELARKVEAIEEKGWEAATNPVTAARDVWLLRDSEKPEIRETANVMAAVNQLQDEVRSLARRVTGPSEVSDGRGPPEWALDRVREMIAGADRPLQFEEMLGQSSYKPTGLTTVLNELERRGSIYKLDEGWSNIPF